jgi:hypothetical protein
LRTRCSSPRQSYAAFKHRHEVLGAAAARLARTAGFIETPRDLSPAQEPRPTTASPLSPAAAPSARSGVPHDYVARCCGAAAVSRRSTRHKAPGQNFVAPPHYFGITRTTPVARPTRNQAEMRHRRAGDYCLKCRMSYIQEVLFLECPLHGALASGHRPQCGRGWLHAAHAEAHQTGRARPPSTPCGHTLLRGGSAAVVCDMATTEATGGYGAGRLRPHRGRRGPGPRHRHRPWWQDAGWQLGRVRRSSRKTPYTHVVGYRSPPAASTGDITSTRSWMRSRIALAGSRSLPFVLKSDS